jgi:serine/threonine protein kinase
MLVQELQAGDPQLIGPYRVVRRLGSGGMGHVYLGRSPGGRLLAIKVIRAELAGDLEFRTRFQREVAAARSVSGLFTAPVVDADLEAPVPWLATAYIAGSSLAETVTRHGPLPAASVLALAAGLAEGLLAIHSAGLVHRDLKPSNVLMADDGPRVIDFGISRAMEASTVTTTGMVVGSPGFMSPEQAEGLEVGPPSDVFSLGAVLAFAATGEGPFGSGSSAALIYRLVHNPPDLSRAPAETRTLIERCLDKDPGRRPSPRQLLAELGEASLAPGWLPEAIVQDAGQPGPVTPVTPVPSAGLSAPPAFGSPSASFPAAPSPAAPVPYAAAADGPVSGAFPAGTGGFAANGVPADAPGDPLTVTHARLSQPAPPPWPAGVPPVTPSGSRRGHGRRRSLVIAGIAAGLVVVAGGVTAGVVSAGGSKHPAAQSALRVQTQATASPSSVSSAVPASAAQSQQQGARRKRPGSQSASPTATATARHSATASPAPHPTKRGSGLRPASLTGTWTGSYFCPQGQTGLRLTLKATASGALTATFSFYPTSTNVSVPSGSFALTGSYTAKGFQLTPDHWISKPQNYSMVGLTGAANGSDTALSGSIVSPECTTFSVSR